MRDLDNLLGALTDRLLQAEARIEELERHETPGSLAFGWAGAVGMLQMLPGLVGLWPGGVIRGSDRNGVADVSGNGLHLARNGTVLINSSPAWPLTPHIFFNGTTGYLSHADASAFDISGAETSVNSPIRGLTLGGWFRFDNAASAVEQLIGKRAGVGNLSYYLRRSNVGRLNFQLTPDGSTTHTVENTATIGAGSWYFLAARFMPSAEMATWINDNKATNTTSIPASIFNSTAEFRIGATASDSEFFGGRAALCFLCAAAVPDVMIETFYQYSKGLFGL